MLPTSGAKCPIPWLRTSIEIYCSAAIKRVQWFRTKNSKWLRNNDTINRFAFKTKPADLPCWHDSWSNDKASYRRTRLVLFPKRPNRVPDKPSVCIVFAVRAMNFAMAFCSSLQLLIRFRVRSITIAGSFKSNCKLHSAYHKYALSVGVKRLTCII